MSPVNFIEKHPAFWIGSILLVGIGLATFSIGLFLPWAALLLFPWIKKRQWGHCAIAILLMGVAWIYTKQVSPSEGIRKRSEGQGYFSIQEVRDQDTPFGKQIVYSGTLEVFKTLEGEVWHHIPCRIYTKKIVAPADSDYLIQGTLSAKNGAIFTYKPKGVWEKVAKTFSFADWRYQTKKKASSYFKKHFGNSKASALFSALFIGTLEERELVQDFRKLGLSHILVISGFHFALYASLLFFLLRPLLKTKIASLITLICLSGYLFFLGASPSVLRAWAAITLVLIGKMLDRRTTGINAIGFGLILELLHNPLLLLSLSFQMSFFATAAILLFYQPCKKWVGKLFIPRSIEELRQLSFLDQHLYLISSGLRKSIAVNFAVHLVIAPLCLLHFQSFPLLGFAYNLFFPFLISLSMVMFVFGSALYFLFPVCGGWVHHLNLTFTEKCLQIVENPPLDITWCFNGISPWMFGFWLLILILTIDKKKPILL